MRAQRATHSAVSALHDPGPPLGPAGQRSGSEGLSATLSLRETHQPADAAGPSRLCHLIPSWSAQKQARAGLPELADVSRSNTRWTCYCTHALGSRREHTPHTIHGRHPGGHHGIGCVKFQPCSASPVRAHRKLGCLQAAHF